MRKVILPLTLKPSGRFWLPNWLMRWMLTLTDSSRQSLAIEISIVLRGSRGRECGQDHRQQTSRQWTGTELGDDPA